VAKSLDLTFGSGGKSVSLIEKLGADHGYAAALQPNGKNYRLRV
jgi:hypothetical protein